MCRRLGEAAAGGCPPLALMTLMVIMVLMVLMVLMAIMVKWTNGRQPF